MHEQRTVDDLTRRRMMQCEVTPVDGSLDTKVTKVKFHIGAKLEPLTKHLTTGDTIWISSLGYMSYSSSYLIAAVVGRYCSIAANVRLMGDNHPTDWATSHVFAYGAKYRSIMHDHGESDWDATSPVVLKKASLKIGNDVWIGRDAVLARGISIGNGAIVAGSAVVTRDVAPYAIVGGVPAKVIRFRFREEIIDRLLETEWWNFRLSSFAKVKFNDVNRFLGEFSSMPLTKLPDCRFLLEDLFADLPPIKSWL